MLSKKSAPTIGNLPTTTKFKKELKQPAKRGRIVSYRTYLLILGTRRLLVTFGTAELRHQGGRGPLPRVAVLAHEPAGGRPAGRLKGRQAAWRRAAPLLLLLLLCLTLLMLLLIHLYCAFCLPLLNNAMLLSLRCSFNYVLQVNVSMPINHTRQQQQCNQ